MALNDSQKLDILWKKINFGKAETDIGGKEGYNEVIPSPVPTYSKDVWQEAELVPVPPVLGVGLTDITEYLTVQCTVDASVTGSKSWLTTMTAGDPLTVVGDWVDTTFSPEYLVEVYDGDPSGSGVLLNQATPDEEWNFDYVAGVLYFANNIPSGLNQVWVKAYRYIGIKGVGGGGSGSGSRIQDADNNTYVDVGNNDDVEIVSSGGNIIMDGTVIGAIGEDLLLTSELGQNISLDGMLFPEADGTAGQVLGTNGAGVLSWVTGSGGPTPLPKIFITDVYATGAGTVVPDIDPVTGVVTSVTGDTDQITVEVLAESPLVGLTPTATIEGVSVNNFILDNGYWRGTAAVTVDNNIEAVHGDGFVANAPYAIGAKAVVSSIEFDGNVYVPNGGTTRIRGGVTVPITIVSDKELQSVIVVTGVSPNDNAVNAGTVAILGSGTPVVGGFEYTILRSSTTINNTNGTDRSISLKVIDTDNYESLVYNSVVTNGSAVDQVSTIKNDNVAPTATFNSINYINGQGALKDDVIAETATVSATYTNATSISYSTPNNQVTISNPTDLGETIKTATFAAGGIGVYNYSGSPNLSVSLVRDVNGRTGSASTTVRIADLDPIITINTPSRLISDPSGEDSTVTISSNQNLNKGVVTMDASIGTWSGTWSGSGVITSTSRPLTIFDVDPKGNGVFSNLGGLTNLAGKPVNDSNIATGEENYLVGGFTEREITYAAGEYSNAIGTIVSDFSKLEVKDIDGVINGSSLIFRDSVVEGDDLNNFLTTSTLNVDNSFTIADSGSDPIAADNFGGFLFILDRSGVTNNTTTFRITIEETI